MAKVPQEAALEQDEVAEAHRDVAATKESARAVEDAGVTVVDDA